MTETASTHTVSTTTSYEKNSSKDKGLWRDLSAFWILGLCNRL